MRLFEFSHRKPILEINFNNPQLAKSALNSEIQCGFEAESIWEIPDGFGSRLEDATADNLEEIIGDYNMKIVTNAFHEWIKENLEDYYNRECERWAEKKRTDKNYIESFIDESEYRDEYKKWEKSAEYPYESEFIKEKYSDEFDEWLYDKADEDRDAIFDRAFDRAKEDATIDQWVENEYESFEDMINSLDIKVNNKQDYSIEDVAEEFEPWVANNSKFKRINTYHTNDSLKTWTVTADDSINETVVTIGAEIISPVYDTPREMLGELVNLFDYFDDHNVTTDESTGLHVTMSWTKDSKVEPNKLKMIILLGDEYLLKMFEREHNDYTLSQMEEVKRLVAKLNVNTDDLTSLHTVEEILSTAINHEKYASIHFKNQKNNYDNNLIEFRIAGGDIANFGLLKVERAVTRYAIIMQAGYDENAYRKDYVRGLIRLINSISQIDHSTHQSLYGRLRAHGVSDVIKQKPLFITVKNFVSKERYEAAIHELAIAYKNLLSIDEPSINEARAKPNKKRILLLAQSQYADVITMLVLDLLEQTNRSPINARFISVLRNSLKDFKLDYESLWMLVSKSYEYISLVPYMKIEFSEELDKLFKARVGKVEQPKFTIHRNSKNDVIFMKEPYRSSYFDDVKIRINPGLFKVVSEEDYKYAQTAYYQSQRLKTYLQTLKVEVYQYKDNPRVKLEHTRNEIDNTEKDIIRYQDELEKFKNKYGFIPDGKKYGILPTETAKRMSAEYNFKIEHLT